MKLPIVTNNQPIILGFKIKTNSNVPLRLRVCDAKKPDTNYTDRTGFVNGERWFYIRMPQTPETVVAQIYNASKGDLGEGQDTTFQIVDKKIFPIETYPEEYDSANELIQCAFHFIQEFSERAGILSAGPEGSVYKSNCGRFRIDYLDEIHDRISGKVLATPARISQDRGIIEVSKKLFSKYAVPYRVAILAHEISHFYVNEVPQDEEEADFNALKMFLGKGYGYIDAENAFLNVFTGTPSDQNRIRHQKLHNYILDFEQRHNKYK